MTKNTYKEKLRDPRWQKRRLEIMQRDDFTCQMCGTDEETLNVHHKRYVWGGDPWDVPNEALVTLCEGCHENEWALKNALARLREVVAERFSSDEVWLLVEMFEERSDPKRWGEDSYGPLYLRRLIGEKRVKYLQSQCIVSPKGLH